MVLKISKEMDSAIKSALKKSVDKIESGVRVEAHWILTGNQWVLCTDFGELLSCGGFDDSRTEAE